jgi:hypothetical protein
MARVQIPAGAFSERSEVNRREGFELRETSDASLAIGFKSRPAHFPNGVSETTVVRIPAGAVRNEATNEQVRDLR